MAMDEKVGLLVALACLASLVLLCVLRVRRWEREARLQQQKGAVLEERCSRIPDLEKQILFKEQLLQKAAEENSRLKALAAEKEARLSEQVQHSQERLLLVKQAQEQLADSFKLLSSDVLKSNIHAFLELASARFDKLQD